MQQPTVPGIMEILLENLSEESKFFLFALDSESYLPKEKLKEIANKNYQLLYDAQKSNPDKQSNVCTIEPPLIQSRHGLDIHTARLEGAGLVTVEKIGQARVYKITDLGKMLLKFYIHKLNNNK